MTEKLDMAFGGLTLGAFSLEQHSLSIFRMKKEDEFVTTAEVIYELPYNVSSIVIHVNGEYLMTIWTFGAGIYPGIFLKNIKRIVERRNKIEVFV